jgi:hypothetical protein
MFILNLQFSTSSFYHFETDKFPFDILFSKTHCYFFVISSFCHNFEKKY